MAWLKRSAQNGNSYAAYRLVKEYLKDRDVAQALPWLNKAVEQENPYAQYLLGKLLWEGRDIPQDKEEAFYWLTQAADQGHKAAQFLLQQRDSPSPPSLLLSITRLLHHMGRIFEDRTHATASPHGQHVDRKLRQHIREKKLAMGHKADDHEEYHSPTMSM